MMSAEVYALRAISLRTEGRNILRYGAAPDTNNLTTSEAHD